jgi:hypothetical protein
MLSNVAASGLATLRTDDLRFGEVCGAEPMAYAGVKRVRFVAPSAVAAQGTTVPAIMAVPAIDAAALGSDHRNGNGNAGTPAAAASRMRCG